jgi:hypothetical protein
VAITNIDSLIYEYDSSDMNYLSKEYKKIRNMLITDESFPISDNKWNRELIAKIDMIINNAPGNNSEFIVYRGIDIKLDNIQNGDILTDVSYMFTSLYKSFAMMFLNNTANCTNNFNKIKKNINGGTLFKIIVPPNIKYYERYHINDMNFNANRSECIFARNTKMKIINIIKNGYDNHDIIETIII